MLTKKMSPIFIAFCIFLLPFRPVAQSSNVSKIGILHVLRAISESNEGKQALGDFQKKANAKADELQKKRNEIEELQKQLDAQSKSLNDESRAALTKNIDSKTTDLQRSQEDAQKEFGQMQNEILNRIGSKIFPVVQQYARENNFTLILDSSSQSSQLVYADAAIDITEDVIKRFNSSPAASTPPVSSSVKPATPQPGSSTTQPVTPPTAPNTPPPTPKK